ncbi:hypothetical protein ABZP36_016127 [Zizania latifolia]
MPAPHRLSAPAPAPAPPPPTPRPMPRAPCRQPPAREPRCRQRPPRPGLLAAQSPAPLDFKLNAFNGFRDVLYALPNDICFRPPPAAPL